MLNVSLNYVRMNNSNNLLSNIKFQLKESLIYTILGKNGSGKSTLIKSFTKLLDRRCYKINGEVIFEGINLLTLSNNALLKIRKDKIKYVFQDSINCFDHLKRFEYYFDRLAKNKNEIDELLDYFLLPEYSHLSKLYAYEVSGGMAQRINFILAL
ncbi:MAG TPA: ATP-binding cassette domain-containing protein, partial [Ignavibacteria bacterium]|nr:ATP-binding cassette domain-containing protein [Ignavibacteria bacterium]